MDAREVASQLERSLQTSVDDVRLVANGEHLIVQCRVFGTLAAARVSSRPRATLEAEHRLIAAGGEVAPVIRLLRPEPVPIPAGNVSLFLWEEGPPFAAGDAAYYEAAAETLAASSKSGGAWWFLAEFKIFSGPRGRLQTFQLHKQWSHRDRAKGGMSKC